MGLRSLSPAEYAGWCRAAEDADAPQPALAAAELVPPSDVSENDWDGVGGGCDAGVADADADADADAAAGAAVDDA